MRSPLTSGEMTRLRRGDVLIRDWPRHRYPLVMMWLVRA